MVADVFPRISFHCLAPPGDAKGASCDENGPAIGPIHLLTKTFAGFAPRPVGELNQLFAHVVEGPVDCAELVERLTGIAKALNRSDFALATLATLFLHLPSLSEEQALRAVRAEDLFKASPDDPERPGWPRGTEDGRGGQFRPKDESSTAAEKTDRLARQVVRQQIRMGLLYILRRHALGLAIHTVGDLIPGLDAVAGVATAADLAAMAEEYGALKRNADAAIEFIQKGPYDLEQLRVSPDDETFSSFWEFKKTDLDKRFGPAGDGLEYHHIVEQSSNGDIPARELQSTQNIVLIPRLLHEEISAQYSRSSYELNGSSLRASLNGASFDDRRNAGLQVMREIGILKGND